MPKGSKSVGWINRLIRSSSPLPETGEGEILPDFCKSEVVVNVVVLAQFLAIVITTLIPPLSESVFVDLFLVSLFIQWIALTSVAALCLLRARLNRLPGQRALIMAYLILLCIIWLVGELALFTLSYFDIISSARPGWHTYFHAHNLIVGAIVNAFALRYFLSRHQLQQKTRSEERVRAEILRHRIRPHFLFNSMNIIASLTRRSPAKAESAIEDMSDLCRAMLDTGEDLSPIHAEIDFAKKYLKLERLRLDRRLKVSWSASSLPRTARTPTLLLQLLLEHAVHNGVEQLSGVSDITMEIKMKDEDTLSIIMESAFPEESTGTEEDKAGLENVRLRLFDHYDEQAHLETTHIHDKFSVKIIHPAFGG